jgi:uncharacterized protein
MAKLPRRLRRLERSLKAVSKAGGVMGLSELDGFVAGLLLCLDDIPVEEWLPYVWGGQPESAATLFGSEEAAEDAAFHIIEHFNDTADVLHDTPGAYSPIFDVDILPDEKEWKNWAVGFGKAAGLRPESWEAYAEAEEGIQFAFAGLVMLAAIDEEESGLTTEQIDELRELDPALIPIFVETLYDYRVGELEAEYLDDEPEQGEFDLEPPPIPKVGRNDPCPCGSGKKYKKCHGAAA